MNDTIQILELFGGIGSPRCALRNLNIPTKAIDYVEINEKAVQSYNSMFREELEYKTQTVVGWNLKPDILIHGSPCQDMSIAGHQGKATGDGRINRGKGSDEGSGTRSSLMWETIHIIENMGEWRPRYVIWENVKNVKSKYMRPNFDRYMVEMEKLGYTNNYAVLDAREFGLPQARERVFTISVLNGEKFEFDDLIRTPMRNLQEFLEDDVPDIYDVTQPSVLACIGEKGIRRATVIKDCAYTITTRQDRTPAQVIDRGDNAAAAVITFMNAWNSYLWPKVIMTDNKAMTMPMLIANLITGYVTDYGMLMCGVLFCSIPTMIVFFVLQKQFAEGITGAVK